jgi:succinyl-CoA synthetase beta subunit
MKSAILCLLLLLSSSCSVIMASDRGGIGIGAVQSVRNRMQLLALGVESISSSKNDHGETVEVFKAMSERGSVARAFMHGLLDLSTAFIWELAGTPIESALDEKKYFSLKVTFDAKEQIKKIELF